MQQPIHLRKTKERLVGEAIKKTRAYGPGLHYI